MATKRKIEAKAAEMPEQEVMEEIVEETQEESYDPNELLFEDGPTLGEVEEWKSLFGQVYLTEFEDGEVFIFRTLKRKEFKDIMKVDSADALYREERVCEKCVVWPENYNFMAMATGKAGAPSLLSEQIMEKSGFAAKIGPIML